jgi:hypothetical protein
VSEWRRSGKTSKEFASETGVHPATLLWWSTKLRTERGVARAAGSDLEAAGGFEQWPIVEVRAGVNDDRFELELGGGRRLRIPPGFDAETLGRLLAVLR